MAERLTEKIFDETGKQQDIYEWSSASSLECNRKLGELEDMLEKYGIESVEELDKKIGRYIDKIDLEAENDYLKKAIEKQNIVIQSISKDRDTWKRACELACDILMPKSEIKTIQLNDDNQIINSKEAIDYFYQQAKQFAGR